VHSSTYKGFQSTKTSIYVISDIIQD